MSTLYTFVPERPFKMFVNIYFTYLNIFWYLLVLYVIFPFNLQIVVQYDILFYLSLFCRPFSLNKAPVKVK